MVTQPIAEAPVWESFQAHNGPAHMLVRPGTNDHNVAFSILTEDEYHLRGLDLHGSAVDIGAHIGAATVALGLLFPSIHITAIEPVPGNVELLRANVEANGLKERVAIRQGVAGKGRKIAHNFRGDDSAVVHRFIGNQSMPTGTLYDKLDARGVSVPTADFAKVDCEGGEWDIIPELRRIRIIHGELHPRDGRHAMEFSEELSEHIFKWSGDTSSTCNFYAMRS